ncbi:MAG: octanoyltransferase [Gammaproteobacteria bacterium]|jgi:lipoyl(octanoyl) transferase|nr:octanoyltransferase [Gammaproteobacteria bacterium]
MQTELQVKKLGLVDYALSWQAMCDFTENRKPETPDEIWICEHPPVFTQGRHGKPEHILNPHNIPVVQSDRGGQVTYHGPGQLIIYFLLDIKRQKLGIKNLVSAIETAVQNTLQDCGIESHLICDAPGVYVKQCKISSIGLRVKHGKTYHGLSLNVDMDLRPFSYINPCGYQNLKMTQVKDLSPHTDKLAIEASFVAHFSQALGYTAFKEPK